MKFLFLLVLSIFLKITESWSGMGHMTVA